MCYIAHMYTNTGAHNTLTWTWTLMIGLRHAHSIASRRDAMRSEETLEEHKALQRVHKLWYVERLCVKALGDQSNRRTSEKERDASHENVNQTSGSNFHHAVVAVVAINVDGFAQWKFINTHMDLNNKDGESDDESRCIRLARPIVRVRHSCHRPLPNGAC